MTMTWQSTVNVSGFSKNVHDVTVGLWKLDILDSDMTFLERKIIIIFNMKTGVFHVDYQFLSKAATNETYEI
jgi:hypothetical protein